MTKTIVFAFLFSCAAQSAITFKQAQPSASALTCAFAGGTGTSHTCTLPSNTTAGDTIIVFVEVDLSSVVTGMSSAQGLTYNLITTWQDNTLARSLYLYIANNSGSASEGVTFTSSAPDKMTIAILEYAGLSAVTSSANLDGLTKPADGTLTCAVTTTNASDLIVSIIGTVGSTSITASPGNLRSVQNNTAGYMGEGVNDQIVFSAGTYTTIWVAVGASHVMPVCFGVPQLSAAANKIRHGVQTQ
jgi:hypothetical protein